MVCVNNKKNQWVIKDQTHKKNPTHINTQQQTKDIPKKNNCETITSIFC